MKITSGLLLIFINHLYCLEFTKWTLTNDDGRYRINNIISPIDVYSALYQNSIIDWPIKGFNDVKYRWISHENWTFTSEQFPVENNEIISLSVSKLDINPAIFINDYFIGTTSSEFVSRDFLLNSSFFKRFNNVLRLKFYSPLLIANFSASTSKYNVPPDCWPGEFHGECHINFIRKTQASFGWDWGPAIPTVGIRGPIQLDKSNNTIVKIKSIRVITNTNLDCTDWVAETVVDIFISSVKPKTTICVSVQLPGLFITLNNCTEIIKNGITQFKFSLVLDLKILKLWWPYEMGTPTLYKMDTTVTYFQQILDFRSQYVGFKHVFLDQTILSNNYGRKFGFYINCRSFFIRGTNWIPRSYLTINWNNKTDIEFLLNSVKMGNMNTIRLWGGGKPEIDHFYLVADRLGLMIWHDLMFACALYPNTKEFIKIVKNEVSEMISNLQKHPSILLWSGNNEIEVLIAQGWYNTTNMDKYNIDRYYNLFVEVIKPVVIKEDPNTPFVLSSPSNGIESENHQGVSSDPQSPYFGDVHFYLYDGDLWKENSYPITRMTTEFGFQSLPDVYSWASVISSEQDFEINGPLMNHLQHHPKGNDELINAIKRYFPRQCPNGTVKPYEKYQWFSYLTQINQANILRVHINKLRSHQCILSPDGKGLTRGAMYWQLNDNWVAPTWSTIDYFGRWKLAHYYVKSSFSLQRVLFRVIDNLVTITIILPDHVPEADYQIPVICLDISKNISSSFLGKKIIKFRSQNSTCNVYTVLSMKSSDFMKELKCWDKRQCLFVVNLLKNGVSLSQDTLMLADPVDIKMPITVASDKISVKISQNDNFCVVTMEFKYIHLYVTLLTPVSGVFSDNGIHAISKTATVTFDPWVPNANEFYNCSLLPIQVISLNELFN